MKQNTTNLLPTKQENKQVDPRKQYDGKIPVIIIGKKNVNPNS